MERSLSGMSRPSRLMSKAALQVAYESALAEQRRLDYPPVFGDPVKQVHAMRSYLEEKILHNAALTYSETMTKAQLLAEYQKASQ